MKVPAIAAIGLLVGFFLPFAVAAAPGNWVSWAMMGYERPAEERIEDKLHEIERLVKEIRKLNTVPRQLEKIPQ